MTEHPSTAEDNHLTVTAQTPDDNYLIPAEHAVFNTTELCERILTHLPVRAIIGALRVCKQWKDCVENSPGIKQKLFINAQLPAHSWDTYGHGKHQVGQRIEDAPDTTRSVAKLNGLLMSSSQNRNDSGDVLVRPVRVSPLLRTREPFPHMEKVYSFDWTVFSTIEGFSTSASGFAALSFLTDPPCRELSVGFRWHSSCPDTEVYGKIGKEYLLSSQDGLTIAHIMRSVLCDEEFARDMRLVKRYGHEKFTIHGVVYFHDPS